MPGSDTDVQNALTPGPRTSRMAVMSVVCAAFALLALVPWSSAPPVSEFRFGPAYRLPYFWQSLAAMPALVLAVPTFLLALVALVQIARRRGELAGRRIAAVGLTLSVGIFGLAAVRTHRLPDAWRGVNCLRNLVGFSSALQMYLADWDTLPVAPVGWNDAIQPEYTHCRYDCPMAADWQHSFALNQAVIGVSPVGIPRLEEVPTLFESDKGPNAVGGRELLVQPPRHFGWYNFGFMDGHAQSVLPEEVSRLRWQP